MLHLPYFLDITPLDYQLIHPSEGNLRGKTFWNPDDVKSRLEYFFSFKKWNLRKNGDVKETLVSIDDGNCIIYWYNIFKN